MGNIPWLFGVVLALLLSHCAGSRASRLTEYYHMKTPSESILFLPLRVDVRAMRLALDRELDQILASQESFSEGDLTVTASKLGDLELELKDREVRYGLPLALDITYDAGISRLGARGDIDLDLRTTFFFDENWELSTQTELADYEWIRKPSLKLGGINLPIGALGNVVVNFAKRSIARAVDEQVRKNVPLRAWIEESWQMVCRPILVEETYRAWLQVQPLDFAMSPFRSEGQEWGFVLRARAQPVLTLGERPDAGDLPGDLPLLQAFYPEADQDYFTLFIRGEVPYAEAEQLARSELLGETFEAGKRQVRVEDLHLAGADGMLQAAVTLSGSFNGTITLRGRPRYHARKKKLEFEDLDYSLDTRNLLYRSAGWLLKSSLKKRLQKELNTFLEAGLIDWKGMIEEQIRQTDLGEDIELIAQVDELRILDAEAGAEGFQAVVGVSGKLAVRVSGF